MLRSSLFLALPIWIFGEQLLWFPFPVVGTANEKSLEEEGCPASSESHAVLAVKAVRAVLHRAPRVGCAEP